MADTSRAATPLDNWAKLLGLVRDGVFICAVYLYFTGFTYRYYYYQHFGLRNIVSDPTPYTAFVLSYTVFAAHWLFLVAAAAIFFVLAFVAARLLSPKILASVAIVAAILLFPCLNRSSAQSASSDALALEQRTLIGRDARLEIVPTNPNSYNRFFLNAAGGYGLHVLARDDKNTYALWQPVLRKDETGGVVFVIPNTDVRHIEVLTAAN